MIGGRCFDQPVESMTARALYREAQSLGGYRIGKLNTEELQRKVSELRKIRDELADEEEREGRREVVGWLRPTRPGLPWTPVIEIHKKEADSGADGNQGSLEAQDCRTGSGSA